MLFTHSAELRFLKSVWSDIAVILSRVVKDGLHPTEIEQLTFLFRIVRNGVAGVAENQDQARYGSLFIRFYDIRYPMPLSARLRH